MPVVNRPPASRSAANVRKPVALLHAPHDGRLSECLQANRSRDALPRALDNASRILFYGGVASPWDCEA